MSIFPVVIIGAGPAGVAAAIEAINRGYKAEDIVILEKSGEIAHMIYTKYPDEKPIIANYKGRMAECLGDMCIVDMSKSEFFEYLHEIVKKNNLKINFHEQVSKITKLKNGQFSIETNDDVFICNAVFVAIGNMAAPRTLGVPIDPLISKKLYFDIQNITLNEKKVMVIGGGDSAGEYCKILSDRGHEVILSYRGSDFNRMIVVNNQKTRELIDGKKITYYSESQIEKIESINGNPNICFKEKKYPNTVVSAVIVSLGTERPNNYLNSIGISTIMETGEFFSESQMSGLFFVGDLVSGKSGGSINFAFNSGVKAVAEACDMYLDCPLPNHKK